MPGAERSFGCPYFGCLARGETRMRTIEELRSYRQSRHEEAQAWKRETGDKVVGVLRRLREPEESEVIEYGVKWKKV